MKLGEKNLLPREGVPHRSEEKEEWIKLEPITTEGKTRLKFYRELRNMTQASLAKESGVSLRLIQAYEQGYKDINKAQVQTVLKLTEALKCSIYDIINDDPLPNIIYAEISRTN